MPPRNFVDLTGKSFDRLMVIARAANKPDGSARWHCQCICGNTTIVVTTELTKHTTKSCGCLRNEQLATNNLRHGQNRKTGITPEYRAWRKMIDRCYRTRDKDFPRWGGRGITVCEQWRTSFVAFFADVGPRPSAQHTLDRYPDNNGPYEPGNVRWATRTEQARNTRKTVFLTLHGETHCLSEWSEILHIYQNILVARHGYGWSDEKILTTPVQHWPRRRRT